MNRDKIEEQIKRYFDAWVECDFEKFKSVVHEGAIVRECTGAVIEGKQQLHRWFTEWNEHGNKVESWDIHSIGIDSENDTAYVEWEFKCVFEGKEYEWDGASIVYFRDELIIELNEYEMNKEKHYPY